MKSMVGALVVVAVIGCENGSSGGGGAGMAGGRSGGGASGGGLSDGVNHGEPHSPATGCADGFAVCGDVCSDILTDSRHCGGCDNRCEYHEGCVDGSCVEGEGCEAEGALCDGSCVLPGEDAAHCGSCNNRCGDTALCVDGDCVDGGGDGSSCASPLFWDFDVEEAVGFHFAPALTGRHTFECGPLEPIPTRWFRLTATKDDTDIDVRTEGGDDYILELFADSACGASSLVACNDNADGTLPHLDDPPTAPGRTYWIAVGLKGEWSGAPAKLRADH